jgi:spore germination protein GerM
MLNPQFNNIEDQTPPVVDDKDERLPEEEENDDVPLVEQSGTCAESDNEPTPNSIKVYFNCTELDEYPAPVKPVLRDIDDGETLEAQIENAIQQVMKGPSNKEIEEGFTSIFNEETSDVLRGIELQDSGHLIVNFAAFIPNGSTTTGSFYMMEPLNNTISQFEEVQTIEYQYNGSCEKFFDWLQVGQCMYYEADNYRIKTGEK